MGFLAKKRKERFFTQNAKKLEFLCSKMDELLPNDLCAWDYGFTDDNEE
jgi:hypothetical protein